MGSLQNKTVSYIKLAGLRPSEFSPLGRNIVQLPEDYEFTRHELKHDAAKELGVRDSLPELIATSVVLTTFC